MFSNNATPPNPLNLFPSTIGPPATQAKLEKLIYSTTNRPPTEIQRTLAYKLFDDGIEYMTTLDMNRAASFTFGYQNSYGQNGTTTNDLFGGTHGESISNQLWEFLIDTILNRSTHHSVLALTKTIHLIQHVLLHGSEKSVMNADLLYRIEMAVGPLRELNTALVEQQMVDSILNNEQTGLENDGVFNLSSLSIKATATMLKLRGGSVDKGFSVRNAASKLYDMVSISNKLHQLRMEQASNSNSLVPVGTSKQVGFITDDARYRLLQQKMAQEEKVLKQKQWREEQRMKATKSNLAGVSASDGFGGGLSVTSGGSQVVGAAHSLEDMINSARYELEQHKLKQQKKVLSMKKGYTDDPLSRARQLEELERNSNWQNDPKMIEREKALRDALEYLEEMQREQMGNACDLLEGGIDNGVANDVGSPSDLLGFDSSTLSSPTVDLLGFNSMSGHPAAPTSSVAPLDFFHPESTVNPTPSRPLTALDPFDVNIVEVSNSVAPAPMGDMGEAHLSLVTGNFGPPNSTANQQDRVRIGSGIDTNILNPVRSSECAGGYIHGQSSLDDEGKEAERSRKMKMAAGLFAGVLPAEAATQTSLSTNKTSPTLDIFAMTTEIPSAPPVGFDTTLPSPSDLSFGATPMGGRSGLGINPPPSTAPPPPPPMAPPPPPLPTPLLSNISTPDRHNLPTLHPSFDPTNLNKDQLFQMMMQQQTQMQEMMKMMASMGMNPPQQQGMSMMQGSQQQQEQQQQQGQNQFTYQGDGGERYGGGWPST